MDSAPCVECGKRSMSCHTSCTAYKSWKVNLDDKNAARRQYIDSRRITSSHEKQGYKKLKSRLTGCNPLRGK